MTTIGTLSFYAEDVLFGSFTVPPYIYSECSKFISAFNNEPVQALDYVNSFDDGTISPPNPVQLWSLEDFGSNRYKLKNLNTE